MGNIGSFMGWNSGNKGVGAAGTDFQAMGANIQQGVNTGQTDQAYNNAQQGLGQQQSFLQALQAQNGAGNQSQVFQQQQALAGQLAQQAQGGGPNPAQAQLAQNTASNVANQSAMMAGQRGAGANVGLLARQAAQQGAATQQQSVGQAATMQAQQQLAAQQALGSQQANMANLAATQVGQQANATSGYSQAAQSEQANLLNALGQFNNANVGMTSNQNSANATIANTTAQGQQGMQGGMMQGLGSALQLARGGMVPKRYADGGDVDGAPSLGVDTKLSNEPAPPSADNLKMPAMSMEPTKAPSLGVNTDLSGPPINSVDGPQSSAGKFLSNSGVGAPGAPNVGGAPSATDDSAGAGALANVGKSIGQGMNVESKISGAMDNIGSLLGSVSGGGGGGGAAMMALAKGGKIPYRYSEGGVAALNGVGTSIGSGMNVEDKINGAVNNVTSLLGGGGDDKKPDAAPAMARGGAIKGEQYAAQGKVIPGRAKVSGNSYSNDTVPAMLSPGEVIIPRNVMQSKNPSEGARKFVEAVMAKQKNKKAS